MHSAAAAFSFTRRAIRLLQTGYNPAHTDRIYKGGFSPAPSFGVRKNLDVLSFTIYASHSRVSIAIISVCDSVRAIKTKTAEIIIARLGTERRILLVGKGKKKVKPSI